MTINTSVYPHSSGYVDKPQIERMIELGCKHGGQVYQKLIPEALKLEVYDQEGTTRYWVRCESRIYRRHAQKLWERLPAAAKKEFQLAYLMSGTGYVATVLDSLIGCLEDEKDLDLAEDMRDMVHEKFTPLLIQLAGGDISAFTQFTPESVHTADEPDRPIEIPEASQD
jgi:hypothetical protein